MLLLSYSVFQKVEIFSQKCNLYRLEEGMYFSTYIYKQIYLVKA